MVLQAALQSLLLLDKGFISSSEKPDTEVAAAITQAFAEHVPTFDYNQQVCIKADDPFHAAAVKSSIYSLSDNGLTYPCGREMHETSKHYAANSSKSEECLSKQGVNLHRSGSCVGCP